MGRKKIETIISEKISPFSLNEKGKSNLSQLVTSYSYDLLKECIDIGAAQYLKYDDENNLEQDSVNTFLSKLGGIAYNKSLPAIEQKLKRIKNKCKLKFLYWDENKASEILSRYVKELKNAGWTEDDIISDINSDVLNLCNSCSSWSQWKSRMSGWIEDIKKWNIEDNSSEIEHFNTIIPEELFYGLQNNFQKLCKQINASYEHNLFDCTAVMMRRLLEGLLVLSYQNNGIDDEIVDRNGKNYSLDKIIKNAEQNITLKLSSNTKKDMSKFKELGNYSAHKIWFNTAKSDIEPNILRFRAVIEELIYKANLR